MDNLATPTLAIFPNMSPIKPKTKLAYPEKVIDKKPTEKDMIVREFLDETTLHGVSHIAKAKGRYSWQQDY